MAPNFYHDRICLNVLANDEENMREIYEATEGHVLIGVLSSSFATVAEAKEKIAVYNKAVHGAVSLGLGAGDPGQWEMVANISKEVEVSHINQVFPEVETNIPIPILIVLLNPQAHLEQSILLQV